MSSAGEKPGEEAVRGEDEGVLSNLPRTRPQRPTARRAAARTEAADAAAQNGAPSAGGKASTGKRAAAKGAGAKASSRNRTKATTPKKSSTSARAKRAAPKVRATPGAGEVPRQGFESEGDRLTGPVAPPGMSELLAGVSEAVNEAAKAGISAGERLVRDLLGRVPR